MEEFFKNKENFYRKKLGLYKLAQFCGPPARSWHAAKIKKVAKNRASWRGKDVALRAPPFPRHSAYDHNYIICSLLFFLLFSSFFFFFSFLSSFSLFPSFFSSFGKEKVKNLIINFITMKIYFLAYIVSCESFK